MALDVLNSLPVCISSSRYGCPLLSRWRSRFHSHSLHPLHRRRPWVRIQSIVTLNPLTVIHSVGALYLWSGDSIRKGTANGLEAAVGKHNSLASATRAHLERVLGASALLFLSSVPRASKGPVPAMLTVTSAIAGSYYGKTLYDVRNL